MKITLEGEPEELRRFMTPGKLEEVIKAGLIKDQPQEPLSLVRARQGIEAVTNNARKALYYICKGAPQIPYASVASSVGVNPQTLGGFMSSYGHSAPWIQSLVERNNDAGFYRIKQEVADILLEALRLYWEENPEDALQTASVSD
jgi:hypothetical protein